MRKLLVRFLALGAHGIQMSSGSQVKLSDCLAPRRSTVLVARPNTLALPVTIGRGLGPDSRPIGLCHSSECRIVLRWQHLNL
jgi:hypothetical protein